VRTTKLMEKLRIWEDTHRQDLIEDALLAGFVAVATGAVIPEVAISISKILGEITTTFTAAAGTS
jgi:Flp pilus assembly pilin Flp